MFHGFLWVGQVVIHEIFSGACKQVGGLQVNWMHSNFGCWSACCALPLVEALETCKRLGGLQDLWLHVSWFVDTRIFFKIRKSMEFLRLGELVPC